MLALPAAMMELADSVWLRQDTHPMKEDNTISSARPVVTSFGHGQTAQLGRK